MFVLVVTEEMVIMAGRVVIFPFSSFLSFFPFVVVLSGAEISIRWKVWGEGGEGERVESNPASRDRK